MKLTSLLLLVITPLHLCSIKYQLINYLPKYDGSFYFFPDYSYYGKYCAFGLDVTNDPIGTPFYIKSGIIDGTFEHGIMYIEKSITSIPVSSKISLSIPISYYFYENISRKSKNYDYVIYKDSNYNYLYFAPPPPNQYDRETGIFAKTFKGPTYPVFGELSKFGSQTFSPSEKGISGIFCFDTNNYKKEFYYYFRTVISKGSFVHGNMYYTVSNTKFENGKAVYLDQNVNSNSSSTGLDDFTFNIGNISDRYLYIAPPPVDDYNMLSQVTVYNTYSAYDIQYTVLGELPKYRNEKFIPKEKGKYCAYYIKTENFLKDSELYFNAEIDKGDFEHEYMFYGWNDSQLNPGSSIILTNNVKRDLSRMNFTIPMASYKYLYIAPPPPDNYDDHSIITVYSINRTTFTVLRELYKYRNETFNPNKEGKRCVFYVKTNDFSTNNIYFKVNLTYGNFENGNMYYGGFNEKFTNNTEINLPNYVYRYSSTSSSSGSYTENTCSFSVPKPSYKYLYIAPPPPSDYNSQSLIIVSNIEVDEKENSIPDNSNTSNKVAIGVGVGVACFVVIVAILSIVLYQNKKRRIESSNIDTSITEPIHLNASHY